MNMSTCNYEYTKIVSEQYKLYVEMADRVSIRRIESNKFYISILSVLLTLYPIISVLSNKIKLFYALIPLLGIVLCFIWVINIESYKALNELKFKVIHELEKNLPYRCFDREWEILKEQPKNTYIRLTYIEKYNPFLFMILYLILFYFFIK